MTKLEATVARLARLPETDREELIGWIEEMLDGLEAGDGPGLTEAQRADLANRLVAPDDFATDEEVATFFARHAPQA
jgi:hypothetical protein